MTSLRFQSVFDIIGPVMIGPSSSHTAGAVRILYLTMNLLKWNFSFLILLLKHIEDTELI